MIYKIYYILKIYIYIYHISHIYIYMYHISRVYIYIYIYSICVYHIYIYMYMQTYIIYIIYRIIYEYTYHMCMCMYMLYIFVHSIYNVSPPNRRLLHLRFSSGLARQFHKRPLKPSGVSSLCTPGSHAAVAMGKPWENHKKWWFYGMGFTLWSFVNVAIENGYF